MKRLHNVKIWNKKNNRNGFTLIELLAAMAIMALLGSALLALINTGSNSYLTIKKNFLAQNEARVAMSYINVKVKQNDIDGRISVVDVPGLNKGLKIVVSKDLSGNELETFLIYLDSGVLKENHKLVGTGGYDTYEDIAGRPNPGDTGLISGLDFYKNSDPNASDYNNIVVTITYPGGTLKETITLRTG